MACVKKKPVQQRCKRFVGTFIDLCSRERERERGGGGGGE